MAASAKVNALADAVKDGIANGLAAGDETEVIRTFHPDILNKDYDRDAIDGRRRVYVIPVRRTEAGKSTREKDRYEYEVEVLVVRRYTDAAGDPPDDWIDAEVAWQETNVMDRLGNERTERTAADMLATFAYCTRSEPFYVYDPEPLQGHKLFTSYQAFTFSRDE